MPRTVRSLEFLPVVVCTGSAPRDTTDACTRADRGHEARTTRKNRPTLGRLARFAGVLTLMVVSTTPRPLAEGVGTLAYIMHGECPGEGATSGYTPHCPLGLALMHPDGSGQLQLTGTAQMPNRHGRPTGSNWPSRDRVTCTSWLPPAARSSI
jgi:hypothetical protein